MAQRIKVQDGIIAYSASDPADDVNVDIAGLLNVTKELSVGNDPLADGSITAPDDVDININVSSSGLIKLNTDIGGGILFNNVLWPPGTPTVGQYLGAGSLGNLQYTSFLIAINGSDILTPAQLNIAYPNALPGQFVAGPTVLYQCISTGQWRTLGGGSSVSLPLDEIGFGDGASIISDPSLTYNVGTSTLSIGVAAAASITSDPGFELTITSGDYLGLYGSPGDVGQVEIVGGYGTTTDGAIAQMFGGGSQSTFNGGRAEVNGGSIFMAGTGDGGPVSIRGGAADTGAGGNIFVEGGGSASGTGGNIQIVGGSGPTNNGNVTIGSAALTTTSTDGFIYIPETAGAPTGIPTVISGFVPMQFDTTGELLWIYTGGVWRSVALT